MTRVLGNLYYVEFELPSRVLVGRVAPGDSYDEQLRSILDTMAQRLRDTGYEVKTTGEPSYCVSTVIGRFHLTVLVGQSFAGEAVNRHHIKIWWQTRISLFDKLRGASLVFDPGQLTEVNEFVGTIDAEVLKLVDFGGGGIIKRLNAEDLRSEGKRWRDLPVPD